jgi:hypothetical protein
MILDAENGYALIGVRKTDGTTAYWTGRTISSSGPFSFMIQYPLFSLVWDIQCVTRVKEATAAGATTSRCADAGLPARESGRCAAYTQSLTACAGSRASSRQAGSELARYQEIITQMSQAKLIYEAVVRSYGTKAQMWEARANAKAAA